MKFASTLIRSNAIFDGIDAKTFKGCIAIRGNKIDKVIKDGDGAEYIGPDTKLLDYGDKMVMAGFVDAHDHFFDGTVTSSEHMCEIFESTSEADAVEMLKKYRRTHPSEVRIRAIGWFPVAWNDAPLPTCRSLDAAFPDIPVYCIAADFHTFWCNSLALKEAGYTRESTFASGSLGKFEDGSLNGLIFEPAAFLKAKFKVFEFSVEEKMENIDSFIRHINENGVTSVADMSGSDFVGGEITPIEAAKEMADEGKLNCRVHVYSDLQDYEDFAETKEYANKINGEKLQLCGVKGFVDGVTSTHTGYLLKPYEDEKDTCGIGCPIEELGSLSKRIIAANAAGLAVRLHCIGDAAVRLALDAYEASVKANGKHGCKNAIEHIETIDPEDIPRFKELDVIASVQPQHLPLDAFEKLTRCGAARCKWEWPFRTMLDAGCKMAFGTDYPVVGFNPYPSIHSAVTRCDMNNEPASKNPEECISLFESLKAYTLGSAEVFGRENEIGSIQEGKFADIIAIDRNLFEIPASEIKDARTIMTMMDGKLVFEQ